MSTPNVNFMIMQLEEHPGKFLMIRQVDEYATHWMDPAGAWMAWPEDDDDVQQVFENLKITGDLPAFDMDGIKAMAEGDDD